MHDLKKELIASEQTYLEYPLDIYTRAQLATRYNSLAWYQLIGGAYAAAERNIQKGMQINIYDLYLPTNLPLSWLLQGKYSQAKKSYLALKDKPFGESGFEFYKDAFLDDLKNFESFGLVPSARVKDVAKIRALLLK